MDTEVIDIKLDKGQEVIVGQGNFSLKTTDDIARVMLTSAPNIKVGVAMNDGGMKITRSSGNDEKLEKKAAEICYRIGAGHVFVVILEGAFPVNVLNDLQHVHFGKDGAGQGHHWCSGWSKPTVRGGRANKGGEKKTAEEDRV